MQKFIFFHNRMASNVNFKRNQWTEFHSLCSLLHAYQYLKRESELINHHNSKNEQPRVFP